MDKTVGTDRKPVEVLIVGVPETAGSALYGLLDVLKVTGSVWQTLTRQEAGRSLFNVRIVALKRKSFVCGNGIPVIPDCALSEDPVADIVILPELWLGPDEDITGRYPVLMDWIRRRYKQGSFLYSACSGALMLAATGLLDGCPATSHWAYNDLFRQRYPAVKFVPGPNLVIADRAGRIVTAGGTTSWHDLVIHIIARHANPGEALRVAKVYLLKWHDEGQLPYAPLARAAPHADSIVRDCQTLLKQCYREADALQRVVDRASIPERTLKRRFKTATGQTFIEYVQNLRIEEAKRLLESSITNTDDISVAVGYEDHSFFRRLFKRLTGVAPAEYRRMFQPVINARLPT